MSSQAHEGPRTGASKSKVKGQQKEKRQEQINRRKMQNRISQQCVREKAQAHARQIESLATIMKTTSSNDPSAPTDMSAEYRALVSKYLALLEMNKELNDALLRMRKKLLSLSTASAAAAEDPIFDRMLSKRSKKMVKQSSSNGLEDDEEIKLKRSPEERQQTEESAPQPEQHGNLRNYAFEDTNFTTSSLAQAGDLLRLSPITSGEALPNHQTLNDFILEEEGTSPDLQYIDFDTIDPVDETITVRNLNTPSSTEVLSNYQFTLGGPVPGIDITSPNIRVERTQKIEEACITYLSQKLGLLSLPQLLHSPGQLTHIDSIRTAIAAVDHDSGIIADVVKIGVDLMARSSGFSAYIYGVGANDCMERILRWRCSPSQTNRMNVPEPFRPTPLQYMNFDHPIAIDFINWPSIRDQLIFKTGTYDLPKMIDDIVSNTVIDIPQFRASINIHDTFITRVFCYSASNYFDQDLDRIFRSCSGLTNYQDVIQEITQKIQVKERKGASLGSALATKLQVFPKHQLASKWGLDRLEQWKLSKEFALAYPEIDCSSITSSFPMYSSSLIPEI